MKKLRFFGLLVTLVLLAFGLTVGCSNGTTDTPSGETKYSTTQDGRNFEIIFGSENGPNQGDSYSIKVDGAEVSSGTIRILEGGYIRFTDKDGTEFYGNMGADGVLTVTNIPLADGSSVSVQATKGGGGGSSGGGGGSSGGGSGGGGGFGGGGGETTIPATVITSYTVEQAGGAMGSSDTTALVFTFSATVDLLEAGDLTITNDSGKAVKAGNPVPSTVGKYYDTWTFDIVPEQSEQGYVFVQINKTGIDNAKRLVPIYTAAGADAAGFVTADGITLIDGIGKEGIYFTTTTTQLKIELSVAVNDFTVGNIAFNTPNNVPGAAYGQAKLKLGSSATSTDNVLWVVPVTVEAQGPVEFFLIGDKFAIADPEVTHATMGDVKLKYSVEQVGGVKDTAATTALKITFAVDPAALGEGGGMGLAKADFNVKPNGGNFVIDDFEVDADDPRVYLFPSDDDLALKQGKVQVTINHTGVETTVKDVQVYKAPDPGILAVYPIQTAGITTHIYVMLPLGAEDALAAVNNGAKIDMTNVKITQKNAQGVYKKKGASDALLGITNYPDILNATAAAAVDHSSIYGLGIIAAEENFAEFFKDDNSALFLAVLVPLEYAVTKGGTATVQIINVPGVSDAPKEFDVAFELLTPIVDATGSGNGSSGTANIVFTYGKGPELLFIDPLTTTNGSDGFLTVPPAITRFIHGGTGAALTGPLPVALAAGADGQGDDGLSYFLDLETAGTPPSKDGTITLEFKVIDNEAATETNYFVVHSVEVEVTQFE